MVNIKRKKLRLQAVIPFIFVLSHLFINDALMMFSRINSGPEVFLKALCILKIFTDL